MANLSVVVEVEGSKSRERKRLEMFVLVLVVETVQLCGALSDRLGATLVVQSTAKS